MLDLYGCDARLLADEAHLRRVLDEYPERIGMVKVSPVELRYIKTNNPLDDGHSGFVIIATSHVSLHAWPPYGMINIDIFSCNEFDEAEVVSFARAMFHPADVEVHSVQRATRSPRPSTFSRASATRHEARTVTGPVPPAVSEARVGTSPAPTDRRGREQGRAYPVSEARAGASPAPTLLRTVA
jgi:S-adenosylmethionine decarboxylase